NQMLVFAVVATILPALALTVASSRQDRRSIVDQIAQELRGTSAEAAWEIDQWHSDRLRDLRVAATAYAVAENLVRAQANAEAVGRLREYLNSVRERCSDCEALLVVEGHGRFVASSGGRMTGVQFSQDRLLSLRTSDALVGDPYWDAGLGKAAIGLAVPIRQPDGRYVGALMAKRSEEHTSELQSLAYLVCRLLLEKKNINKKSFNTSYNRAANSTTSRSRKSERTSSETSMLAMYILTSMS